MPNLVVNVGNGKNKPTFVAVAGAQVYIRSSGVNGDYAAIADGNGQVTVNVRANGDYAVFATNIGYDTSPTVVVTVTGSQPALTLYINALIDPVLTDPTNVPAGVVPTGIDKAPVQPPAPPQPPDWRNKLPPDIPLPALPVAYTATVLKKSDNSPIVGAFVWATLGARGDGFVSAGAATDGSGNTTLQLNAGVNYFWIYALDYTPIMSLSINVPKAGGSGTFKMLKPASQGTGAVPQIFRTTYLDTTGVGVIAGLGPNGLVLPAPKVTIWITDANGADSIGAPLITNLSGVATCNLAKNTFYRAYVVDPRWTLVTPSYVVFNTVTAEHELRVAPAAPAPVAPGANTITLNVTSAKDGTPLPMASILITSDAAGQTPVAYAVAAAGSNSATALLANGTYYVWAKHTQPGRWAGAVGPIPLVVAGNAALSVPIQPQVNLGEDQPSLYVCANPAIFYQMEMTSRQLVVGPIGTNLSGQVTVMAPKGGKQVLAWVSPFPPYFKFFELPVPPPPPLLTGLGSDEYKFQLLVPGSGGPPLPAGPGGVMPAIGKSAFDDYATYPWLQLIYPYTNPFPQGWLP